MSNQAHPADDYLDGPLPRSTHFRKAVSQLLDAQFVGIVGNDAKCEQAVEYIRGVLSEVHNVNPTYALTKGVEFYGTQMAKLIEEGKHLQYPTPRLQPVEHYDFLAEMFEKRCLTAQDIQVAYELAKELSYAFKNAMHPFRFHVVVLDVETGGLASDLNAEHQRGSYYHPLFSVAVKVVKPVKSPAGEWGWEETAPLTEWVFHYPEETLEHLKRTNKYVYEMHEKSGLLEKVRASDLTPDKLEATLLWYFQEYKVPKHNWRTNTVTCIGGNSIYTDYEYITSRAPRVGRHLNYQLLDFSALQIMNKMTGLPVKSLRKNYSHSAGNDVEESLEEGLAFLRFFGKQ